ncbi:prolipoprotein diacylglyceryl transferase [Aquabacterium sp.]|uniref:prolipoprotein diacylglyceryl transferase n=1 Tax=Aquabacterium sp. TaxID=1872578 RepID=UPI0037845540
MIALSAATAATVHAVAEYGGIAVGAWLYRRALRAGAARNQAAPSGLLARGHFAVVVGLLLGAALGNKAVFLVERPDVLARLWQGEWLMPGQSIVGGLLGGLVGVELAKWLTAQTRSTGDALVAPLVVGICIGRIGCFLAGLHDDTYGLPTTLPWGVDLGGGVPRHPSPLYEIAFLLAFGAWLWRQRGRLAAVPGLQFKCFLSAYLLWRLFGDGLKPVRQPYALGLSGIQWVCIVALALYLPLVWRAARRLPIAAAATA